MIFRKWNIASVVLACSLLISQLEPNMFGQNLSTRTVAVTAAIRETSPATVASAAPSRNSAAPASQEPDKPKKRGWVKWVVIAAAGAGVGAAIALKDRTPVITVQAPTIVPQ